MIVFLLLVWYGGIFAFRDIHWSDIGTFTYSMAVMLSSCYNVKHMRNDTVNLKWPHFILLFALFYENINRQQNCTKKYDYCSNNQKTNIEMYAS